jgi:hypothetical protein
MNKILPVEIVAIYFPSWHVNDHYQAWYGENFCEWEIVKSARPIYPGHHQPKIPSWGYFDESDPEWSAQEIDLAANHGITTFLFDWYWYNGVQIMEEVLERMNKRIQKNGLPGIYFIANIGCCADNIYCCGWDRVLDAREMGFKSVFAYNIVRTPEYETLSEDLPVVQYENVIQSHLYT